jgi:hypothetical protein
MLSNTLYKYTGAIFLSFKEVWLEKQKKNRRRGDSGTI